MKPSYEIDGQYITIYDQDGKELYDFDLNRVTTSAQMLDWIYQVKSKRWCTADILFAVIDGFDEACRKYLNTSVQGAFCPGGKDHKVNFGKASTVRVNSSKAATQ